MSTPTHEPLIMAHRFDQAADRLEVLRGVKRAPDRLLSRLLRKYHVINMRDINHPLLSGKNFRMVDMGLHNE